MFPSTFDTERRAARNAAISGLIFVTLNIRRKTASKLSPRSGDAKKKSKFLPPLEPLGQWEEAARCAAGAGVATEAYGVLRSLLGRPAAAVASVLSLRAFMDDPRLKVNYKFLVSYAVGQALIEAIPALKRNTLLVMVFSTAQLLTWWLLSDRALPRQYQNFLYDQGKINRERVKTFRALTYHHVEGTNKDYMEYVFPLADGGQYLTDPTDPKDFVMALAKYFATHLKGSVPFYCKIYALRFLMTSLTGKREAQMSSRVLGVVRDVMRSSVFLSAYCSSAFIGLFTLATVFADRKPSPAQLWVCFALPGFTLLLETPSQQKTIAFYCATFGVHPVLEALKAYDAAAVGVAALSGAGKVKACLPFQLLWGEDPSKCATEHHPQAIKSIK